MNKVLLIIQREYVTRVRKRAFIVMIFVLPLLILAMGTVITLIGEQSDKLSDAQTVKVIDNSGEFAGKFKDQNNLKFETATGTLESLRPALDTNKNILSLVIPADFTKKDSVKIYSKKKPGITLTSKVEDEINSIAMNNGLLKNH